MLAAFPPPGETTPLDSPMMRPPTNAGWPTNRRGVKENRDTTPAEYSEKKRTSRTCCGMRRRNFIFLLLILMVLVAAAVVVPIVLIVLPRMRNEATPNPTTAPTASTAPTPPTATNVPSSARCANGPTCLNGGIAVTNTDNSCNCVCVDGFTGNTCTTQGDSGCTTTSIQGISNNATIGTAIPRLVSEASSQFAIPLNSTRLLSIFSRLSLSCTTENALVTFNGLASRSAAQILAPQPLDNISPWSHPPPHHLYHVANRQTPASPTPTQIPFSSNTTALDFARVAVLFAVQLDGQLDAAANTQEALQSFMTANRDGATDATAVHVGPFTLDLVQLTIRFDNGTTLAGGKAPRRAS